ncbi:hypothetical protein FQN53_007985 [Emmonsiellopsis sp. PD_33]|nr:hypothetical protein FQN53_007985 [Emmonsiellopsis sp. PD_33]
MHALHYTSPSGAFLTHLGTPTIYAPRLAAKGSRFKTGTIKHPRVRHETSTSIYVSTPPELSPSLAHPRTNTGPTTMRSSIEPQESPTTSPPSSKNPLTNTPHQYSTFPSRLKTWLVILVAIAAWLSTLSSFIYFPALTSLAASLHVSISKIDLTVTTYLIVSAIAPAISGDLADVSGRRPVIVVCLIIYFSANVALALQRIFALAYGVVGDIASPAERGGTNSAPAFGPLIGTLLLAFRGWESIFWFLAGISATCLVLVIFTLPETARKVVGDGSVEPPRLYRLPFAWSCLQGQRGPGRGGVDVAEVRFKWPNPLACLYRLWDRDNFIAIYALSILYLALNSLQASLSALFMEIYGYNVLQAGLIYLPFGIGSSIFAFLTGKILNATFASTARAHNLQPSHSTSINLHTFPIAQARLKLIPYSLSITIISIIGYGWALHSRTHPAIPLSLQFIMGAGAQSCFTMLNTLIVDLNSDAPSTAQASCNIVRCAFAGVGTAVLHIMIEAVGVGWYFTILGLVCATPAPLLVVQWRCSVEWRRGKFGGDCEG